MYEENIHFYSWNRKKKKKKNKRIEVNITTWPHHIYYVRVRGIEYKFINWVGKNINQDEQVSNTHY